MDHSKDTSHTPQQILWPGTYVLEVDSTDSYAASIGNNPGIAVDGAGGVVHLHRDTDSRDFAVDSSSLDSDTPNRSMTVTTLCRPLAWRHDRIDCVASAGLDSTATVVVSIGWARSREFGPLAYGPLVPPSDSFSNASSTGTVIGQGPSFGESLGMGLWIGALVGLLVVAMIALLAYHMGWRRRGAPAAVPPPAKEAGDPHVTSETKSGVIGIESKAMAGVGRLRTNERMVGAKSVEVAFLDRLISGEDRNMTKSRQRQRHIRL